MINYDFLQKYNKLQRLVMYDEVFDLGFATVVYSKSDKSGYWNNALVNKILNKSELEQIEKILISKDRTPSIYFENRPDLTPLSNFLESSNYKKAWEDSWQFWKSRVIDNKNFESVKRVTSQDELSVFLSTFNDCYQKDDPQNPYGEVGTYLKVTGDAWNKNNKTNNLEYFIVYKESKPVAVSALTSFEGIGYISNVGSLREVRGQGFGKLATLYCVSQSIKNGNNEHCLATEEGAYPNEFYKRIGFETRFAALGYTKKK